MISSTFLLSQFTDTYAQIMTSTAQVTHAKSMASRFPGVNPVHWVLGHVVVARCNFMMPLGVGSIWTWETCKLFIPGSTPSADTAEKIAFEQLREDLERTQALLAAKLAAISIQELSELVEGQTIAESLLGYAVHESYHTGQLDVLYRKEK